MINIFLTQLVFNLELIIDIFALVSYFLLSFVFNPYASPVSLICINLHTVTHSKYARSSLPCMKSLLDTCVPSRIGLWVAVSCPMGVSLQGHLQLFWFLSWVWSLISYFPSLLLCSSIFLGGATSPVFQREVTCVLFWNSRWTHFWWWGQGRALWLCCLEVGVSGLVTQFKQGTRMRFPCLNPSSFMRRDQRGTLTTGCPLLPKHSASKKAITWCSPSVLDENHEPK